MVSLTATKALAAVVMLVCTFSAGFAPNRLFYWMQKKTASDSEEHTRKQKKKVELAMSLMLAFGGGVLLATAFLHIIPEVNTMMAESIEHGGYPDIWFPVKELIICVGIFLIAVVEEVAHALVNRYQAKKQEKEKSRSSTAATKMSDDTSVTDGGDEYKTKMTVCSITLEAEDHDAPRPQKNILKLGPNDEEKGIAGFDNKAFDEGPQANHASVKQSHGHCHDVPVESLRSQSLAGAIRSLLVIIALAAHCVLEGLTIGLEDENKDVWLLTLAILVHKLVIIFCLGLEMASARVKIGLHSLYVFIFAIMSPVGIIIGLFVTNALDPENAVSEAVLALLQALGAGTLLYVVFFEILEKEKHQNTNGLLKWAVVMIGFGCLAALQLLDK